MSKIECKFCYADVKMGMSCNFCKAVFCDMICYTAHLTESKCYEAWRQAYKQDDVYEYYVNILEKALGIK